jgi:hypothetical protein
MKLNGEKLVLGLEGDLLGAPAYLPRVLSGVWLFGFMTNTLLAKA